MDGSWQANGSDAGKDGGSPEDSKGASEGSPHTAGSSVGSDTKLPVLLRMEPEGRAGRIRREPDGGSRVTLPCSRQEETSQCPAESFTIYTVYLL